MIEPSMCFGDVAVLSNNFDHLLNNWSTSSCVTYHNAHCEIFKIDISSNKVRAQLTLKWQTLLACERKSDIVDVTGLFARQNQLTVVDKMHCCFTQKSQLWSQSQHSHHLFSLIVVVHYSQLCYFIHVLDPVFDSTAVWLFSWTVCKVVYLQYGLFAICAFAWQFLLV